MALIDKLSAAYSLLDVNWRPKAEPGALHMLDRCASALEAAYLLGVAYFLEQTAGMPIVLQPGRSGGLWFVDPGVGWKLPRVKPVAAPLAMLIVPQHRGRDGRAHTFAVYYSGDDTEPPRWRLEYVIDLDDKRHLTVEGRAQRFKGVASSPRDWFRSILLMEMALT